MDGREGQARSGEAGWSPGDLYEAAREGRAQDARRRAPGLHMT